MTEVQCPDGQQAIQAYSMSLAVEASNAEMLPGDLEDTRFLKVRGSLAALSANGWPLCTVNG